MPKVPLPNFFSLCHVDLSAAVFGSRLNFMLNLCITFGSLTKLKMLNFFAHCIFLIAGDHGSATRLGALSTENTAASPSSVDIMQDSLDMEQASPPHRIAPKTPTDDDALVRSFEWTVCCRTKCQRTKPMHLST